MSWPGLVIDAASAAEFLDEAARYFENRPTGGEDRAYWSNVYNSENCRKIATLLRTGTSAFGQDAQRLEAKPAGPVGSEADDAP